MCDPNSRARGRAAWAAAAVVAAQVAAASGGAGCATAVRPQRVADTVAAPVLARVDGVALGAHDLPVEVQAKLTALRGSCAQRQYALSWAGLEEAIGTQLLAAAAARRHVDVEALLHDEVDSQVGAPSQSEIRNLYDSHRAAIDVPFAEAEPELRGMWQAERVQQLRRALIDRLRGKARVEAHLPPPSLPRHELALGDAEAWGPADAPVSIVAFASFTCPYSAQARRLLQRLRELYPDDVRVIHRDLLADDDAPARRAAIAATCARAQGKFWPLYEQLFDHHGALTAADVERLATQVGLDRRAMAACEAAPAAADAVAQSSRSARDLGVSGTPTLFVNGMQIDGVLPLPLMQALVEHELAAGSAVATVLPDA